MHIEQNKSLKQLNTFGIDATAKYFAEIKSVDDYRQLITDKDYSNEKQLILGGGSNLLFTQNFDGLVVRNNITGIELLNETDKQVIIKAAAGQVWHQLVMYCIDNNYAGIENLSLIPGCVGAAPMQNIGAYGVELKDVFFELEAVHVKTGELVKFNLTDCEFGYRESVFKGKFKGQFLISSVSLRLTRVSSPSSTYKLKTDYGDIKNTLAEMQCYQPTIKDVSAAVIKIRSSKLPDPKVLGNAGSFFKNPVISVQQYEQLKLQHPLMPGYPQPDGSIKAAAGWLIEQCGWKGKVVGHTGSHKTQALVLVNYGSATGHEVWNLALAIQRSVYEKFGIEILPEVNVV